MHQDQIEPRLKHLEGIIKGDGKEMGIGPLVLKHEDDIYGSDGLVRRVRKLEDQSLRIATFVGAAVLLVEIVIRIWDKVKL